MTFLDALNAALGDADSTDTTALAPLTADKSGHDSRSVPLALVSSIARANVLLRCDA